MLIRRSLLGLSLLLFFVMSTVAQDTPIEGKQRFQRASFIEQLGLTEDQQVQMKEIQSNTRSRCMEIIQNEGLSEEAKELAIQQIRKENEEQVSKFLNKDQFLLFQEWTESRRGMRALRKEKMEERKIRFKENREARKERVKQKMAFRQEMREYRLANIDPILKGQRAKLEAQLSVEDKQKIDEIRSKRADLKSKAKERKANLKERKEEMKKKSKDPNSEDIGSAKAKKEKMRKKRYEMQEKGKERHKQRKHRFSEDIEVIEYLLDKYEVEISDLMNEIEDDRSTWEEDIQQIRGKFKDGKKAKKERKRVDKSGKDFEKRKRIHFLLMAPNRNLNPTPRNLNNPGITDFVVYPNPSIDFSTIKFNLEKGSNVKIGLYAEGGKLIKSVLNEYVEAGEYEFTVGVSDLPAGYYIYSISTEAGVQSKSILISE